MSQARPIWLWLFWALAAAGFIAVLTINLPGQLSVDSVLQLYEGRNNHQMTFNPWIMSWMLGLADAVFRGTGLFVALNAALLFAALAMLPLLRGTRAGPRALVALAFVLITPQIVNFQGIVWKDVLFANLTVAGFVVLGLGLVRRDRPDLRWGALAAAVLMLAVAGLVRQNGLIAAPLAALACGIGEGRRLGWRRGLVLGAGGFVAIVALAFLLGAAIRPGSSELKTTDVGLRVLRHYDIAGAVSRDPSLDLGPIPPQRQAVIRALAPAIFSPERVDTLDSSRDLTRALWQTPKAALAQAWGNMVLHRPGLYVSHRITVFRQVFLTPDIARCGPVTIGVDGPAQIRQALGLTAETSRNAGFLRAYQQAFHGTPLFSHLTYAILALAVLGALATRREAADLAVMGLMLAGLGFAASFFLISIACDYRYLYMLDLAALAGLVYWALDPPPLKFKRRAS